MLLVASFGSIGNCAYIAPQHPHPNAGVESFTQASGGRGNVVVLNNDQIESFEMGFTATLNNDEQIVTGNVPGYNANQHQLDVKSTEVPEPDSYAMVLVGIGLLIFSATLKRAKI